MLPTFFCSSLLPRSLASSSVLLGGGGSRLNINSPPPRRYCFPSQPSFPTRQSKGRPVGRSGRREIYGGGVKTEASLATGGWRAGSLYNPSVRERDRRKKWMRPVCAAYGHHTREKTIESWFLRSLLPPGMNILCGGFEIYTSLAACLI